MARTRLSIKQMDQLEWDKMSTDEETADSVFGHKRDKDPHPQYLTEDKASTLFNSASNQQAIVNVISVTNIDGGNY